MPIPPARRLRRFWRVVLLVVPIVVLAAGGLAAILAIEHVRDRARTEGTIAAVAQANATQVRQGAITVRIVGSLLADNGVEAPVGITASLARLSANGQSQMRGLEEFLGDRPEAQQVLASVAQGRRRAIELLFPPVTQPKLERASVALSSAADQLDALAATSRERQRAADHRANTVTLVVLLLALVALASSWWGFLAVTGRMQRRHVAVLRHLAGHDPLTGLGNRRALDEASMAATGEVTAVAVCDLDGFKNYNDQFGHPAGDALLQRLGGRLAEAAEARDGRAFRLGGDEFCVLVPGRDTPALDAMCREALAERGEHHAVETSVGVAVMPDDGHDLTSAMHVADTRLYDAKRTRYTEDPGADRRAQSTAPLPS